MAVLEGEKLRMWNVAWLGIAFMLLFTAFQTMGNVQTTVLNSAKNSTSQGYVDGFHGDGFVSLAIIYTVFAMANWFAPSVVSLLGLRITMLTGAVVYTAFIAQILYPNDALLYSASVALGFGAAIIWTAQGSYLTLNSTPQTMSRNSGIFWALLQSSMLIGNTFVFFVFRGKDDIDKSTRTLVVSSLTTVSGVGVLTFLLLRPPPPPGDHSDGQGPAELADNEARRQPQPTVATALKALKDSWALFRTKKMLLLSVNFLFTGFLLSFWSGVYGTSVANTKAFGSDAKSYNGLHGIMVGLGEILGGMSFGILGKATIKYGRDPVVMLGFVCTIVAAYLTFLNIPFDAPFLDSSGVAYIVSSPAIALTTSFLLGFGDSCFNTQAYSILGHLYPEQEESASAFAIFKFVQSSAAAISFFYSNTLSLPYQLGILVVSCILGTVTFCLVEWGSLQTRSHARSKDEDNPSFDSLEETVAVVDSPQMVHSRHLRRSQEELDLS